MKETKTRGGRGGGGESDTARNYRPREKEKKMGTKNRRGGKGKVKSGNR